MDTPSEYEECKIFVQWLRLNNIPHSHCANESQSGGKNAIIRGAKLKAIGQSKGVFDYDIYIPVKGIDDEIYAYQMLAIEMKKKKGSTTSKAQKEWLKVLEMAGIPSRVCKGCEEAIKFVEEIKKEIHGGEDE